MSKTTIALEALVADVIANRAEAGAKPTARQRANTDRAFASILKLIAPRIRHFIRQYGLVSHWEDAEQAAAIAVHRAIEAYDSEKAQFTTFVNWQIRGEMQSLRFRLMTDQRSSAKKVEAMTISLGDLNRNLDGEDMPFEATIEDEDALAATEADASAYLAKAATSALIDEYIDHLRKASMEQLKKRPRAKRAIANQPGDIRDQVPERRPRFREIDPVELAKLEEKLARNREIVERRVFDTGTLDELGLDTGLTKERVRQITKRAAKTMGELVATNSKFNVMADYKAAAAAGAKPRKAAAPAPEAAAPAEALPELLPDPSLPHNRLTSLVAIRPEPAVEQEQPAVLADFPVDVRKAA
ncbi:sigma-70 family RNA polymerase sigma factor [Sphingomonas parva]|uniref:Sigma-70 family RNA polymerase sigma factor n=1 Tax=Sphingomonas parva TaxID=2555898 RepID=A0A4Y8ZRQ7_9SPHN|nr:sigma factor-like helix-turn-helix DNA-binding protein [Sphingomonas parva]TFI57096.1 sigma-70 family RNA polymerase sigma factor [Sphingomonas parva]